MAAQIFLEIREGSDYCPALPMQYRPLGQTGLQVSALSLGTSPFGSVFRPVKLEDCVRTVQVAFEGGINFFDTSPAYGETVAETNLGIALRGVPRSSYFLATKAGSYGGEDFDYSAARTERSVHESLTRLGVSYVDLLHLHDIEYGDHEVILKETIPTLLRLKEQGLVRHLGITGLPLKIFPSIIDRVPAGTLEAMLSFCHYALNDTSLEPLLPYFKKKGVGVINASCTGMGLLSARGAPAWHPGSQAIKDGCRKAVEFCQGRGVDIVKVAVQFAGAQPDIATTLIGTASPENLRDNLAYFNEAPDWKLIAEVLEVLRPIKDFNYTRGRPENRDGIVG
jgi:L-galactose dehydrogenase